MSKRYIPLGSRIIVKEVKNPLVHSSIIRPDTEKRGDTHTVGEVIATGPDCTTITNGDLVCFMPRSVQVLSDGSYIFQESTAFAVIADGIQVATKT